MFNISKKKLTFLVLAILVLAFLTHLVFFSPVPKSEIKQISISKNKELSLKVSRIVQKLFPQTKITVNIIETKSQNPGQTLKINQEDEFVLNLESQYFVKSDKNQDKFETKFLKKVLSHELMHILSLLKTQFQSQNEPNWQPTKAEFDKLEAECKPNYFNLYGCFLADSHLSKFFGAFWTGQMKTEYDQIQKIEDKLKFNQELNLWGQKNQSKFVSKTASIDAEEDLAESFSVWVLDLPLEMGQDAKEKVLFFQNLGLEDFKNRFKTSFDLEFGL